MSAESVKTILGRAVREPEFRGLLFRDPGQALLGHDLTEAETMALRRLTPENFNSLAAELEARISRSAFGVTQSMEQATKRGEAQDKA